MLQHFERVNALHIRVTRTIVFHTLQPKLLAIGSQIPLGTYLLTSCSIHACTDIKLVNDKFI